MFKNMRCQIKSGVLQIRPQTIEPLLLTINYAILHKINAYPDYYTYDERTSTITRSKKRDIVSSYPINFPFIYDMRHGVILCDVVTIRSELPRENWGNKAILHRDALKYLIENAPFDYYLSISGGVDGLAVPEDERPTEATMILLVNMYDRTGCKVFARTYERKYENTLDASVPAVDVYEHYLKQLISDSAEAMNKDLAFLKTAATPTGPTLKDYMEGKSK